MGQEKVDVDGLSASLNELVKAADATDVVKAYGGVNVESYGHVDERGKTSGGYADQGDVGGIDDMMIGKMQAALVEAGFSVDQIAAFMGDDEDEDDDMNGKQEAGELRMRESRVPPPTFGQPRQTPTPGPAPEGRPAQERPVPPAPAPGKMHGYRKSMDDFRADPDIADAVDISPYLEAMTSRTADHLDGIRKSLVSAQGEQQGMNKALAGGVYQIGQLVKSIASVVDALDRRLGLVERTPAQQKGVTSMHKAMTKMLPGEVGGGEQLGKSEILSTLSYMNLEKGIRDINGRKTSELVGFFEAGNIVDQGTVQAVQQFLATHPADAKLARTYR